MAFGSLLGRAAGGIGRAAVKGGKLLRAYAGIKIADALFSSQTGREAYNLYRSFGGETSFADNDQFRKFLEADDFKGGRTTGGITSSFQLSSLPSNLREGVSTGGNFDQEKQGLTVEKLDKKIVAAHNQLLNRLRLNQKEIDSKFSQHNQIIQRVSQHQDTLTRHIRRTDQQVNRLQFELQRTRGIADKAQQAATAAGQRPLHPEKQEGGVLDELLTVLALTFAGLAGGLGQLTRRVSALGAGAARAARGALRGRTAAPRSPKPPIRVTPPTGVSSSLGKAASMMARWGLRGLGVIGLMASIKDIENILRQTLPNGGIVGGEGDQEEQPQIEKLDYKDLLLKSDKDIILEAKQKIKLKSKVLDLDFERLEITEKARKELLTQLQKDGFFSPQPQKINKGSVQRIDTPKSFGKGSIQQLVPADPYGQAAEGLGSLPGVGGRELGTSPQRVPPKVRDWSTHGFIPQTNEQEQFRGINPRGAPSRPQPLPPPARVRQQTQGGQTSSPYLANQRQTFFAELDNNPDLRDRVMRAARAENGRSSESMSHVIEAMVNRANMNGYSSLRQALDSGFYGPINRRASSYTDPLTERQRRMGEDAIGRVRSGQNQIDFRTDQGMLTDPGARRYMQEPDHSGHIRRGGENYFYMGKKGREWAKNQREAEQKFRQENPQLYQQNQQNQKEGQPQSQRQGVLQGALPERVTSAPANWGRNNLRAGSEDIVNIQAPNGAKFQVNKNVAGNFQGFLNELDSRGYKISSSGGYNFRTIRGSGTLSQHAYGNAIDINAARNTQGGGRTDMPPDAAEIAAKHGLSWGGLWRGRTYDPMHFEFHEAHGVKPRTLDDFNTMIARQQQQQEQQEQQVADQPTQQQQQQQPTARRDPPPVSERAFVNRNPKRDEGSVQAEPQTAPTSPMGNYQPSKVLEEFEQRASPADRKARQGWLRGGGSSPGDSTDVHETTHLLSTPKLGGYRLPSGEHVPRIDGEKLPSPKSRIQLPNIIGMTDTYLTGKDSASSARDFGYWLDEQNAYNAETLLHREKGGKDVNVNFSGSPMFAAGSMQYLNRMSPEERKRFNEQHGESFRRIWGGTEDALQYGASQNFPTGAPEYFNRFFQDPKNRAGTEEILGRPVRLPNQRFSENLGGGGNRFIATRQTHDHDEDPSTPEKGVAKVAGEKGSFNTRDDRILGVYRSFRNAGFSDKASRSLVAEVNRENSFGPGMLGHADPVRGQNLGFISWQGSRRTNLERHMKNEGVGVEWSQRSLDAQARFLKRELTPGSEVADAPAVRRGVLGTLNDPNASAEQINQSVGRNYIRWAIDNPKYRETGLKNIQQGHADINRLLQQKNVADNKSQRRKPQKVQNAAIVGGQRLSQLDEPKKVEEEKKPQPVKPKVPKEEPTLRPRPAPQKTAPAKITPKPQPKPRPIEKNGAPALSPPKPKTRRVVPGNQETATSPRGGIPSAAADNNGSGIVQQIASVFGGGGAYGQGAGGKGGGVSGCDAVHNPEDELAVLSSGWGSPNRGKVF